MRRVLLHAQVSLLFKNKYEKTVHDLIKQNDTDKNMTYVIQISMEKYGMGNLIQQPGTRKAVIFKKESLS